MVLDQVQDWLSDDSHDEDARLVVLTCGAIAIDSSEDVTDLGQAAVWGLLRSAQTENPGRISLADVDDWASADVAVAETAGRDESQLALRDGAALPRGWCDHRATRWRRTSRGGRLATRHPRQRHAGLAERRPAPVARIQPSAGARRSAIGLRCTGVNFRDVLIALGLPRPIDVGCEGSGVVLEVADDVLGFAPGDRVMGLFVRRGTCCRRRSPDDRAHPLGVVLRTGSGGTGGFPHRVLRVGGPRPRQRGRAGAGARRHRRSWHGCGAAGSALGPRGVCDGQPWQMGNPARHGIRRRPHRELAHGRVRAEVLRGNRTGRAWTSYSIA